MTLRIAATLTPLVVVVGTLLFPRQAMWTMLGVAVFVVAWIGFEIMGPRSPFRDGGG